MKVSIILSTLVAATVVSAGKFHASNDDSVVPNGFIVEYEDNVTHTRAFNGLKAKKVDFDVRSEFKVFNGAAIQVKSDHKGAAGTSIAQVVGVKNVWPIRLYKVPKVKKVATTTTTATKKTESNSKTTSPSSDPFVNSPHLMTGVDVLQKKFKLTGKGIKVGLIDTGIDFKHPAFAAKGATEGCFARYGEHCRVIKGWDFVGDKYNGQNTPKPDGIPNDCNGHGTHVAGIIGGNAANIRGANKPPQPFVGVAPEVMFGAYRVFGCDGKTSTDIVLSAMELAFNERMNIINLSLEGGAPFADADPIALLGDELTKRGMAVSVEAGDNGTNGVWMVNGASAGKLSTSVGSFESKAGNYDYFTYGDRTYPYQPSSSWNKRIDFPQAKPFVYLRADGGGLADGCEDSQYDNFDVEGKIVLIAGEGSYKGFKNCGSQLRTSNAKNHGAAGAIFVNYNPGLDSEAGVPGFPSAVVEATNLGPLSNQYQTDPETLVVFGTKKAKFVIESEGNPSEFSSYGLDGDLYSKPDISAPGGNILSTYPLSKGGYATLSSSSMAASYITGAHALFWQAKKGKVRGDIVRQYLKNTATIGSRTGAMNGALASAAKQGSGLVNVLNAIQTTTTISPDHIDQQDSTRFKKKVQITIMNRGKKTETYSLSHLASETLFPYQGASRFPVARTLTINFPAKVTFSSNQVMIKAGKTAKITLTFTPPTQSPMDDFVPIYSGFVVATPKTKGGIAVHVPYTGVHATVKSIPLLDRQDHLAVLKCTSDDKEFHDCPVKENDNTIVIDRMLFDTERPAVVFRLGGPTRNLSLRVYKKNTDEFMGFAQSTNAGPVFGQAHARNPNFDNEGKVSLDLYGWRDWVYKTEDLTSTPVQLSGGSYVLRLAAQKFLTSGSNYPEDFDVIEVGIVAYRGQQK